MPSTRTRSREAAMVKTREILPPKDEEIEKIFKKLLKESKKKNKVKIQKKEHKGGVSPRQQELLPCLDEQIEDKEMFPHSQEIVERYPDQDKEIQKTKSKQIKKERAQKEEALDEVRKFRDEYETSEEWEMRRRFLIMHWGEYPENRLLCLSRALVNVHFLGCTYPADFMRILQDMGGEILTDFQAKTHGQIKPILAFAGKAAEAKFTRFKPNCEGSNYKHKQPIVCNESLEYNIFPKNSAQIDKPLNTLIEINYFPVDSLKDFVILEVEKTTNFSETAGEILSRSAKAGKLELRFNLSEVGERQKCEIFIGDYSVVSCIFENRTNLPDLAYDYVYRYLKKYQYTVRYKVDTTEIDVSIEDLTGIQDLKEDEGVAVGEKLLRLIGWQGGGLGKYGQGMKAPISVASTLGRKGLGFNGGRVHKAHPEKHFRKDVREYLKKYIRSGSISTMKFSSEFTSEQRKIIHKVAQKLNLKHKSCDEKNDRMLKVNQDIANVSPMNVVDSWKKSGCLPHREVMVIPPAYGTP
ncbi:uncharacterized protein LOC136037648 isoform X1 [Artemia franciscana]|uniref:uncharacterized protein LOC136037648 isoform X1 n=2 Tax=Artemia franciscana TaxID=6661 RepID=UPI0032DA7758